MESSQTTEEQGQMVTVNQGVKEVRDVGSKFVNLMEAGALAAYNWVSGPAMTEQDRVQHKLAETEFLRRFPQTTI